MLNSKINYFNHNIISSNILSNIIESIRLSSLLTLSENRALSRISDITVEIENPNGSTVPKGGDKHKNK